MGEYLIWSMVATGFMLGASVSVGVLYVLISKKFEDKVFALIGLLLFSLVDILVFIITHLINSEVSFY